jgi:hypothetical protein
LLRDAMAPPAANFLAWPASQRVSGAKALEALGDPQKSPG